MIRLARMAANMRGLLEMEGENRLNNETGGASKDHRPFAVTGRL
jgi:hypothetical protein